MFDRRLHDIRDISPIFLHDPLRDHRRRVRRERVRRSRHRLRVRVVVPSSTKYRRRSSDVRAKILDEFLRIDHRVSSVTFASRRSPSRARVQTGHPRRRSSLNRRRRVWTRARRTSSVRTRSCVAVSANGGRARRRRASLARVSRVGAAHARRARATSTRANDF